jgi:peptidoglycan/LPS O-acetylase OafA/YrhL
MTAISDWLGRLSYSMYLFHIIVLQALAAAFSGLDWVVGLPIYLALTFIVAALMYSAVEAPVLAQRPRFRQHPDLARAATSQPSRTTAD